MSDDRRRPRSRARGHAGRGGNHLYCHVHLGLGIVLSEFRGVVRDSGLVGRALFAVLVAVPVLAVVVVRAFDLPRPVQVGTVLMPGSRIGTLQLTAWRAISRSISAMCLYQRLC